MNKKMYVYLTDNTNNHTSDVIIKLMDQAMKVTERVIAQLSLPTKDQVVVLISESGIYRIVWAYVRALSRTDFVMEA